MKDITLVIMAAGMGSRFGGIKQLEPVGPSGEIIMDYSVYDALEAGFNRVVFIIRKDLEEDFRRIIGDRIESRVKVDYVFQGLDALPEGFQKPEDRTKPWGTGQAVLCCKEVVTGPFAVINADDYYGKESFKKVYEYLSNSEHGKGDYCLAGFILGNTLSENGTVTRGVCKVENSILVDIDETSGIELEGDHVVALNKAGEKVAMGTETVVSMNMWGFQADLFDQLDSGFTAFLQTIDENPLKKEYLLPEVIKDMIQEGDARVSVLTTNDRWFGVTYKEDKASVVASFDALIEQGIYPVKLFA